MGRLGRGLFCVLLAAAAIGLPTGAPRAAQTTQYTYDALGRVLSAIDANGKKVVYTYDAAGNRTRVSNGAEFTEIVPTAWSASSNAGTTGLVASNGMRDGDFNSLASIHATNTEANAWVQADLGSVQTVNHIDVAPALASAVGASPDSLNGTVVEYSTDGAHWAAAATINAVSPGATRTVAIGGVSLRYLRLRRTVSGQVAIGDLRLYSAAVANSPLIANPDGIASTGAAVTFDPRTNDQDLDGYAISIGAVEDPPHGTAVVNSGASITYTPDAGYYGADSFLYTVADGHNGTASARVTVLVRSSTNHGPVAVDDNLTVSDRVSALVDGTNALRPADNDYDADGDVLTITAKTDPAHGTVTIVGSNVIQYQPTVSYDGLDSFTYTISDGRGLSSTATVHLTVANANPVAGTDNIDVSRAGAVTFDARLNDRDPDGDPLTIMSVSSAAKGVAVLNGDQTITYTAGSGSSGIDTFTYALADGRGGTATGFVSVDISGNAAPIAVGDNIAAGASAVTFDPRANDTDPDGDVLTVTMVGPPSHGTVVIAGGGTAVTYTANAGYSGADTFTYTVSDPQGATSSATVAVNSLSVDYFVVAGGGGGAYYGGGGGGGGVLQGRTTAPPSSPLTVTVGSGGSGGLSNAAGGNGGNSSFGVISATGGGAGGGQSTATTPSGGSGGGASGNATGGLGIAGQGFNGGGNTGTYAAGGGGGAGAAGSAANSYLDTSGNPAGAGGAGGSGIDSPFSGSTVNYAAGGGGYGTINSFGAYALPGAAGGSSAGAGSANGVAGGAAAANRGGGGGGSRASGGAGGSGLVMVRYAGPPKATGGTITQAGGYTIHTFTASGTFTVTATNRMPVAVDDSITATAGAKRVFDPRVNDSDLDGDPLTVSSVGSPQHGTAVVQRVGLPIIYTPAPGYTGPDNFSYTISDGSASATANVAVNVVSGPQLEFLIVGGGGGGAGEASSRGGGGGGGGVLAGTIGFPSGSYTVTVGSGGAGAIYPSAASNGGDSSFAGLTALGGGAGGRAGGPGASGGSGGGGSNSLGGVSLYGQGRNGGAGKLSAAGGGGGAGGVGQGPPTTTQSGDGGPGTSSAITGTAYVYGSGGGGGSCTCSSSTTTGGQGGMNAGSGGALNGGSGVANSGGGGAGGGYDGSTIGNGGTGGSGVVVIRYPTGSITGATGGTITTSGGYTIHKFTSSGTFVMP